MSLTIINTLSNLSNNSRISKYCTTQARLRCIFCMTSDTKQSKVFKNQMSYLHHISRTHSEINDSKRKSISNVGKIYFEMIKSGVI